MTQENVSKEEPNGKIQLTVHVYYTERYWNSFDDFHHQLESIHNEDSNGWLAVKF